MPKTKFEDVIFTAIMATIMVYGMIVYNVALNTGGVQGITFLLALHEMPIMVPIAFVLEFFVVGKLAKMLAFTVMKPTDRPAFITYAISICICCIMCPIMSLIATILFKDRLPVIISERLLKPDNCNSNFISVQGEIRSYDKWLKEKSRLKVYVFATYATIKDTPDEENKNSVVLTGHICRKPTYRLVDNKKEISDFIISVKRKYNKSDYIPCVCWGRTAKYTFGLDVGTEITITGRFQSRDYIKSIDGKDVTRTTYEVSASNIKVV